jgi:hypothetical protein
MPAKYVTDQYGQRVRAGSYTTKTPIERYNVVYNVLSSHSEKSPTTWVHRATAVAINGADPCADSEWLSLEYKLHSLRDEIDGCLREIANARKMRMLRKTHGRTPAEVKLYRDKADEIENDLQNWMWRD